MIKKRLALIQNVLVISLLYVLCGCAPILGGFLSNLAPTPIETKPLDSCVVEVTQDGSDRVCSCVSTSAEMDPGYYDIQKVSVRIGEGDFVAVMQLRKPLLSSIDFNKYSGLMSGDIDFVYQVMINQDGDDSTGVFYDYLKVMRVPDLPGIDADLGLFAFVGGLLPDSPDGIIPFSDVFPHEYFPLYRACHALDQSGVTCGQDWDYQTSYELNAEKNEITFRIINGGSLVSTNSIFYFVTGEHTKDTRVSDVVKVVCK